MQTFQPFYLHFFQIIRIQQEKRDIPDKPPPPYTPPASPRPLRPRAAIEIPKFVPSSKTELTNLIPGMIKSLLATRPKIRLRLVRGPVIKAIEEEASGASNFGPSRQKFVTFLFDLVTDVVDDVFRCDTEPQSPAWLPQKPLEKQRRALPSSETELLARVNREILVAFNYEKKSTKENLVVR